jgi:pimeloyl-ACP methyl ester carboxylesterase
MTTTVTPTSTFVEVNGLRLHYLDWGNHGAPVIVCVHGLTSHAHAFDGFARRCAGRFHVVALDVRGRGDSAWSPAGEYTMAAYTADLVAFIDALGLTRFTLVGTSMGGRISMHYAAAHAGRLDRLVLNDIGPDSEAGSHRITAVGAARPASFASLDDAVAYRFRTVPAMANASAEVQRETARYALREGPDGRWVWKHDPAIDQQRARDGAHGYPELWQVLASLPCPTLLLWGSISDVLSEAQARKIVATLPHGTLAMVAGSAHAPTLNEPDAAAALEDFLSTPVGV